MFSVEIFSEMCYREDYASWNNRRVICMRMRQYTVLKCPTQAFFANCLRSLPTFAACFVELNVVYWEKFSPFSPHLIRE